MATYFPIRDGTRNMGYLNAVFRIEPMVRRVLGPAVLDNYAVRIVGDGRPLFTNGLEPLFGWETRVPAARISVGKLRRRLYVFPIRVAVPLKRRLGNLGLLLAGVFLAAVIAGLTRQALSAHERLRRSEERYRDIFESSMDAIYVSTPEGRLVDFNDAMVRLFKAKDRSDLLRTSIETDLYEDPSERRRFLAILERDGSVKDYPLRLKALDGSLLFARASATVTRSAEDDGRMTSIRGILHDETDKVRLQEELIRSQRLESMSDLAGGIAHDFNNILAAIMANASLLELKLDAPELTPYIEGIQTSVESAARLTSQLLQFARGSLRRTELVDLNALVEGTLLMLERTLDPNIIVGRKLAKELPPVEGDPGRLQQILLNLLINARDALGDGGQITVETAPSPPPEDLIDPSAGGVPGEWVRITVADTGHGMDEATQKRIFEPFFTTKGRTKGTGLGLAVAYGVVRDHGGALRVDSAPGTGAAFHVFLPAASGDAAAAWNAASPEIREAHGTILVVDDDEAVRRGLAAMLDSAGYRIIEAADGLQALEIFGRDHELIDAILLDMTMPGPDGIETMARLRGISQGIPIVLSSGYSEGGWDRESRPPDAFLQKPYDLEELLTTVQEVLSRFSSS